MTQKKLADIAEMMRGIDIAMMLTDGGDGRLAMRPMSNNGQVEYDGDSYYFTYGESAKVAQLTEQPKVSLTFSGKGVWLAVTGMAELIRDKAQFKAHWSPDLDRWFEKGIDTPGIVLIKVKAEHIRYWQGEESGELDA